MTKCAIIGGGEKSSLSNIKEYDFIIACDKGLSYALENNIKPDLILGDFDSFLEDPYKVMETMPNTSRLIKLPEEKDDTDTLFAIKEALNLGYKKIDLFCSLGGRLDHTIANIQACLYAKTYGAEISIQADNTFLTILSGEEKKFKKVEGSNLSIFALGGKALGVSLKGCKYPLQNASLTPSFPIGISNEFISDVVVSVEKGYLLVMVCFE